MTAPQRGWKARQSKAIAKRETTDDLLAVRAERAAIAAAAAHSAQEEAEARRVALAKARCTCPACDGNGTLSLDQAERIITALARLPAFVPVDGSVMLALKRIASGHEVSNLAFPETTLSKPRIVAETVTASPVEPAKVTPKAEPVVTKPTRKLTAAEVHASADGAILDLDI